LTPKCLFSDKLLALVAAGIGISIVPESLVRRSPEQVVFKKLTGDVPTLEIHKSFDLLGFWFEIEAYEKNNPGI